LAEGLSGRFVKIDKKKYGIIPGVTDRDYYTNSFHVPVYFPISAFRKIDLEAPYHALCNGGHITYIEMDGDPSKNVEAFEKIVRYMHDAGIGYGAINHPVDRDPVCGYSGIIDDICPRCGRREGEPMTQEMWAKIKYHISPKNASNCGYCGDLNEEADRMINPLLDE
jgi:ribonucleoside-triphosphate reductase